MAAAEIFLKPATLFSFLAHPKRWSGQKERMSRREVEETRARLDFILGMMDTCPEAFASEDAVRNTALFFSGRF